MEQNAGERTGDPVISVIIPHLNTPDAWRAAWRRSYGAGWPGAVRVIVVDNGSRPAPDAVIAAFPGVRLLVEPAPGPGPGPQHRRGQRPCRRCWPSSMPIAWPGPAGWPPQCTPRLRPGEVAGGDVRIETSIRRNLTGIEAYECVFGFRQHMYIRKRHFSVTANMAMPRACTKRVGPFGGHRPCRGSGLGPARHRQGLPSSIARPCRCCTRPAPICRPATQV
jgi:hypothetical protein